MRAVYLIAYDICDARRYRQIHRAMCGHGDRMQYSVFRCELSELELQGLKEQIWPVLNLAEDRVMIAHLGPIDGRGDCCLEFWGEPCIAPTERSARIV